MMIQRVNYRKTLGDALRGANAPQKIIKTVVMQGKYTTLICSSFASVWRCNTGLELGKQNDMQLEIR